MKIGGVQVVDGGAGGVPVPCAPPDPTGEDVVVVPGEVLPVDIGVLLPSSELCPPPALVTMLDGVADDEVDRDGSSDVLLSLVELVVDSVGVVITLLEVVVCRLVVVVCVVFCDSLDDDFPVSTGKGVWVCEGF